MPSEKQIRWLEDILDNIALIERFTDGRGSQEFLADERTIYAVMHALLILSEAARRLGSDADTLIPGQPWRAIRDLGNVLRHEYGGVDRARIWEIVVDDLPSLKEAIGRVLREPRPTIEG